MVNPSFAGTYGTAYAAGKGELLVSAAATTNNGGLRNIYYGNDVPYHSWDGGITFTAIGTYFEDPTHGDVRSFFLQQATNTLRGDSDRLLIATDGGVSLKQAGIDDYVAQSYASVDISGAGLATGTFWSFSSGEGRA